MRVRIKLCVELNFVHKTTQQNANIDNTTKTRNNKGTVWMRVRGTFRLKLRVRKRQERGIRGKEGVGRLVGGERQTCRNRDEG